MSKSHLISFGLGLLTLVIIYIFDWFKFRSNLHFIISKICCCCSCCNKKEYGVLKEEGNGKNLSEIILEKCGLLIRTHPYGKGGIQGLKKLKFVKVNRAKMPDFSNLYNNYTNNFNYYQMQMLLNNSQKEEEKIVNNVFEFTGNNTFKEVTSSYNEIQNDAVDKSILFNHNN